MFLVFVLTVTSFTFPLSIKVVYLGFLFPSLWVSGCLLGWGTIIHYYCSNAIDAIIIRKFVLQYYPCSGHPHNTTRQ